MPADLAYCGHPLLQRNPSQSERSLVCSSKSLHFPYIGSRPIVLFQTDVKLLFTSRAKPSKVDFFAQVQFQRDSPHTTAILDFSRDLICTLLTRPAPCPH